MYVVKVNYFLLEPEIWSCELRDYHPSNYPTNYVPSLILCRFIIFVHRLLSEFQLRQIH